MTDEQIKDIANNLLGHILPKGLKKRETVSHWYLEDIEDVMLKMYKEGQKDAPKWVKVSNKEPPQAIASLHWRWADTKEPADINEILLVIIHDKDEFIKNAEWLDEGGNNYSGDNICKMCNSTNVEYNCNFYFKCLNCKNMWHK